MVKILFNYRINIYTKDILIIVSIDKKFKKSKDNMRIHKAKIRLKQIKT
jgi:hypothetical protein